MVTQCLSALWHFRMMVSRARIRIPNSENSVDRFNMIQARQRSMDISELRPFVRPNKVPIWVNIHGGEDPRVVSYHGNVVPTLES